MYRVAETQTRAYVATYWLYIFIYLASMFINGGSGAFPFILFIFSLLFTMAIKMAS